jgi:hypothetical protein
MMLPTVHEHTHILIYISDSWLDDVDEHCW